jgi:hypothetical protein
MRQSGTGGLTMKASKEKQLHTLENAILAMRDKIEEQIPVFKAEPLAQTVTVGTGESMVRQNPNISEFRALVKDYGNTLKTYEELKGKGSDDAAEISSLDTLRSRFKVAK